MHKRKYEASLTVEASIVLWLVCLILAAVMLLYPFLEKEIAIYQTMYEVALHGQKYTAINPTVAQGELIADSYRRWNKRSSYKQVLYTVTQEEEELHYCARFVIQLPGGILKHPLLASNQEVMIRNWQGYERERDHSVIVYITKTGSVYHIQSSCYHLLINIKEVRQDELTFLRNRSGGKYYPCQDCAKSIIGDILYITSDGTRYHTRKTCKDLLRYIKEVELAQVQQTHRPCKDCSKGED